jgi:hypothetical protein
MAFLTNFLDLCAFAALFQIVTEAPREALRNPTPVPKTYPQRVVQFGDAVWGTIRGLTGSRSLRSRSPLTRDAPG